MTDIVSPEQFSKPTEIREGNESQAGKSFANVRAELASTAEKLKSSIDKLVKSNPEINIETDKLQFDELSTQLNQMGVTTAEKLGIENADIPKEETLIQELGEKEKDLIENLPSVEDFPEKAKEMIKNWINRVRDARQSGKSVDDLISEIDKTIHLSRSGTDYDYAHLWSCREMYLAAKGKMLDSNGNEIPSIDLRNTRYLFNRRAWPIFEEGIQKGESVFSHAVPGKAFHDILRQGAIVSRDRQNNPNFNTRSHLKSEDQEKHDVSFAWDDHTGTYGLFAFVIPTELALKDAVFCEVDGIHVMNKNVETGYAYDLSNPYVVIVPNEVEHGYGSKKFVELDIDGNLAGLGWNKEQIEKWKIEHLVIADRRDEKENTRIVNGVQDLWNNPSWNLRGDYISPLKQRVLEKLKSQGYAPSLRKQFFPVGEKNNLGTRHDFWLYQLK